MAIETRNPISKQEKREFKNGCWLQVGRATEVKGISRKLGGGKKEAMQKQCMDEVLGLSRYFDSNIY